MECSFSIKLPKMWATHTFSGSLLEADEVESEKTERSGPRNAAFSALGGFRWTWSRCRTR